VGRHGVATAGVVLNEDALLVAAVHVARYQVQLVVAGEGQVAHPRYVAVPADGVYYPEALNLRHSTPGLEETIDAAQLDEDGPAVGGDREAQAEQERAVSTKGRALEVDGQVIVAHQNGPLLFFSAPRWRVSSIKAP
jgi:hypothetical protein